MRTWADDGGDLEHGTGAGYRRHLRDGERPCDECRAANTEQKRQYIAQLRAGRQVKPRSKAPAEHGTYAAWNRHNVLGEPPCDECRAAATAYNRARRKRQPDDYAREKRFSLRHQKRVTLAAQWVRQNHPEVWADICRQVRRREFGA